MINLLPTKEKETLAKTNRWKLSVILSGIVAVGCLVFLLILVFINFFITFEIESRKGDIEKISHQIERDNLDKFEEKIEKYNRRFQEIESFYNARNSFKESLEKVVNYTGDLDLDRISIEDGPDSLRVSVSGFSRHRDNLIEFRNILNNDEKINRVNFSSESWIRDENIRFSVNFEMKNE